MKLTSILLIFMVSLVATQKKACNDGGCVEKNSVNASDPTDTSVKVTWSHSCLQCSSWEVGRKKKVLGIYPPWYNWMTVSTTNSQAGHEVVVGGLDENRWYKFKVKSKSGNACNTKNIGTDTQKTTN